MLDTFHHNVTMYCWLMYTLYYFLNYNILLSGILVMFLLFSPTTRLCHNNITMYTSLPDLTLLCQYYIVFKRVLIWHSPHQLYNKTPYTTTLQFIVYSCIYCIHWTYWYYSRTGTQTKESQFRPSAIPRNRPTKRTYPIGALVLRLLTGDRPL